ncbi:MAG: homoserine O-acetyltransferase [Candidatus Methylomirabilales bacterium]
MAFLTVEPLARNANPVIVKKETFELDRLELCCGATLEQVRVGYETYGTLSPTQDNAILICHFFSGASHAAGRYSETDVVPGYWDAVIGPGKPFDTDRYFIVSSDTLCNLNAKDPRVVTTGPASPDPKTGKPYGMSFPIVTIRDFINVQHSLIRSLGIEWLHAVAGPSMGGFQALEWAIAYPEMVKRAILVISAGELHPWVIMMPGHVAETAIRLDPNWQKGDYYGKEEPRDGLALAFTALTMMALSQPWADRTLGRALANPERSPADALNNRFLIEAEIEKAASERAALADANSFIYLARANALYRAGIGFDSLDEALERIRAKVLLIPCSSDLFLPPYQSQKLLGALQQAGVRASSFELESDWGHLAGVFEIHKAEEILRTFLESA